MKSKTLSSKRTILTKTVSRYWPIWATYAFIWLISLVPMIINRCSSVINQRSAAEILSSLRLLIVGSAVGTGSIMSFIFACVVAMVVFGHLYSPRAVGGYAALPINRKDMFASLTAAALLPALITNAVVFLVCLGTELWFGYVDIPSLLLWFAIVSLLNIGFFGIAAFCGQLTGNIIVVPLLYVVLNFLAVVIESLINELLSILYYGFVVVGVDRFSFLSPPVYLLMRRSEIPWSSAGAEDVPLISAGTMTYIIAFAIVGALLIFVSRQLYRHRRMEAVEEVVAVKALGPAFKYCMAFGSALVLGIAFYRLIVANIVGSRTTAVFGLCVVSCLAATIGYFTAEMLLKKSFYVIKEGRRWLGLAIVCILCIFIIISSALDLYGYERYVPTVESVKSVSISVNGGAVKIKTEDGVEKAAAAHSALVADRRLWQNMGRIEGPGEVAYVFFEYSMEDGATIKRSYQVMTEPAGSGDSSAAALLETAINSDEAVESRYAAIANLKEEDLIEARIYYSYLEKTTESTREVGYSSVDLTPEEAIELAETCLIPDMRDRNLADLHLSGPAPNTLYDCSIEFLVRGPAMEGKPPALGGFNNEYFSVQVSVNAKRTVEWLKNYGIELTLLNQTMGSVMYKG